MNCFSIKFDLYFYIVIFFLLLQVFKIDIFFHDFIFQN